MTQEPVSSTLQLASRVRSLSASPMLTLTSLATNLREQGRDIISLAAGEPDFDTPTHIQQAAFQAVRNGQTHYTPADGTKVLKESIQRKFARENDLKFNLDQISVSSGAKQVIYNAFVSTLDNGDQVIVSAPFYPSYLEVAQMCGAEVVAIQTTHRDGFKIASTDLEAAITDRTRWFVINSPCNPTGSAYTAEDLASIADVLLRHPHVWILTDDIYEHLLFSGTPFATIAAVEPRLFCRTLTVNGVSKSYCMTGWRIGYGGGPAELIKVMSAIQSQAIACPSSISQAAACAALDGPQDVLDQMRETFRQRRDLVVRNLNQIARLHCPLPDGAFYVFPSCEGAIGALRPDGTVIGSDHDYARYLLDAADVAVVPGSHFGAPGHIRISYAADTELLAEACVRIKRATDELSDGH